MSKDKPHGFCETPHENCTMNYCDENGCMNRKRNLVGDSIEMSNDKQTTAVSQLIEIYKGRKKNVSFRHTFNFIDAVLADLEMQLPKERQQIEEAYNQGTMDWDMTDEKDYFESTFTQFQTNNTKPTPPLSQFIKEGQDPR